jgi:gluconate 2-dehydrogenase gamma chain
MITRLRRDKKWTATPMTNDQSDKTFHPNRRGFLGVAAATGAASLAPGGLLGTAALAETSGPALSQSVDASASSIASKLPSPVPGYLSFGPDESGFVEAMVNVMCPADALTPGGVDCGLAAYIDRQLAGGFGKGARLYMRGPWREGKPELGYQLPLTPEQFFKAGLAAADAACRKRNGKAFVELDENGANQFLHEIAGGKVTDERIHLASWFNELVYPLFEQACFADPVYGGNVGKVFWKAIGYPGLPAVHSQDMVDFRGKPFPGAADPKSIADFA